MTPGQQQGGTDGAPGAVGVLCALPEESGMLRDGARSLGRRQGIEVHSATLGAHRVLLCVSGVGKVRAAHAASVLVEAGATRALLVVGTCGGLRQDLAPGTLVHCTVAAQTDLGVRDGREQISDPMLRAAWQRACPGPEGWFLTADRAVLSLWRRLRLARAFAGPCVADMETAAAAVVARAAGVPWAALRAVTDRATGAGAASFRRHFPTQAGRAADTVQSLLEHLDRDPGAPSVASRSGSR